MSTQAELPVKLNLPPTELQKLNEAELEAVLEVELEKIELDQKIVDIRRAFQRRRNAILRG